jgi:thioredoxin reductase (NADPH)
MSDEHTHTPCTVIGSGPAGVSAVLWLRTFDMPFRWLSSDGTVGGMVERIHNPLQNYPGANFSAGAELVEQIRTQLDELDGLHPETCHVESLERRGARWDVTDAEGSTFETETVILATGATYRTLGVPGEQEGLGDYVRQSTAKNADEFAGRTVAIVGGGDAALEGALQLARRDADVHLLLRSEPTRARPQFVEPVEDHPRIFIHPIPTTVERIDPLPNPRGCRLQLDTRGERADLEVACLFVRIGVDPAYPAIDPEPDSDPRGHLIVDKRQRTSVDRLLACGEVTDTELPSIAVSVGDGATAARTAAGMLDYA